MERTTQKTPQMPPAVNLHFWQPCNMRCSFCFARFEDVPIRRRVLFRGRVQGVGFRYTTASIARQHPVVGFVRNLPDGSVELVAEADAVALDRFLEDIASEFTGNIRQQEAHDVERTEKFTRFEIRR